MASTVPLSRVAIALGLSAHEHVALGGGGGKTTTMHALATQLAGSIVVTSTTRMGTDQTGGLTVLVDPSDGDVVRAAAEGPVTVWGGIDGPKALGVPPERCDTWFAVVDHVLVEADGARCSPFKAPAPHEPVVPSSTTTLVSMIGIDAIGKVIGDRCHRPLRVAALAGCQPYERLTALGAARVLLHPDGARRALPETGRLAIVMTKVAEPVAHIADELAQHLHDLDPDVPVIAVEHT